MPQNEITLNELLNAKKEGTINEQEYSSMCSFMLMTIINWEPQRKEK